MGFSVQVAHAAIVDAAASRDDRAAKDPHSAVAEAAAPRETYVRCESTTTEVGHGDGEAQAQQLWLVQTRVG